MNNMFSFKDELLSCDPTPHVLLLLSGGKDSVCCLYLLNEIKEIKLEAIFFKHTWGSEISHNEAVRHCKKLGIPLHEIDYTKELCSRISTFKMGRPCLTCKPIMYQIAIEYALKYGFTWIATGDNANDRTTITRLRNVNLYNSETRLFCSHYLGNEQGINLPEGISIVRPLLKNNSYEIRAYLKENKIKVTQNSSTGDKYFEYSREGCCLQFCDPGTELTYEVCESLFRYNEIANEWGRRHNVRTSVHLPSTFVVTIPEGFENDVCKNLVKNGLPVNFECNTSFLSQKYCSIVIENYPDKKHDNTIFQFLINRLAERLSLTIKDNCHGNSCVLGDSSTTILVSLLQDTLFLNLQFTSDKTEIEDFINRIRMLCIEIFHSRAIGLLSRQSDNRK